MFLPNLELGVDMPFLNMEFDAFMFLPNLEWSWIIWSPLQDHTDFSFDKSFSGVWNSSGINVCTKSPGVVDGGPSEDQVSTRNICVKNDINEDIYELLWK